MILTVPKKRYTFKEVLAAANSAGYTIYPLYHSQKGYGIEVLEGWEAPAKMIGGFLNLATGYSWIASNPALKAEPIIEPTTTTLEVDDKTTVVCVGEVKVAAISYDDADFVTQPYVVKVEGEEIFRSSSWQQSYSYITWHYKNNTLPLLNQSQKAIEAKPEKNFNALSSTIEVLERHGDEYVVCNKSNGNHYVVRPNHPQPNQRCECPDCYFRSRKCKHQQAVEGWNGKTDIIGTPPISMPLLEKFRETDETQEIEEILEKAEVDIVADSSFGDLHRLWYDNKLIGTFYRKIFSDDWIARPNADGGVFFCQSEDDAKFSLIAHFKGFWS